MRGILKGVREDIVRDLQEQFQPALQFAEEGRQQSHQQAVRSEAASTAREAITTARSLPHFREHEKLIAEELAKIPRPVRDKVGSVAAMYMAYNKVLSTFVLPALGAQTEASTIADLQRSAQAGSSAVGATSHSPAPQPKIREGNVDDLAKHMESLSSRMASAV